MPDETILQAAVPTPVDAGRRNLLLLVQLRWLAVGGQLATMLAVRLLLDVTLPLTTMVAVLVALVLVNCQALLRLRRQRVTEIQLFGELLVDVACLTIQLYLSGGTTNPFITLYLLQVVLGAVLLHAWGSWLLVALTSTAFATLSFVHRPLPLPEGLASTLSSSFVLGSWFNFTLVSVLLVQFVTRIARNLRDRDAHLAALRQRAAEQEHIVRMGLLASGAAHELGTPLASISVALGDWRGDPAVTASPQLLAEVEEMRVEVARCKTILGGILFAAGEVTGEAPARTSIRHFIADLVRGWSRAEACGFVLDDRLGGDVAIVADRALGQALVSLLDNAADAGAAHVTLCLECRGELLILTVGDDGTGFPEAILAHIGTPYRSSKQRRGAGLGLFLVTNVLRTLGGTLDARNRVGGRGAVVQMCVPLAALGVEHEG